MWRGKRIRKGIRKAEKGMEERKGIGGHQVQ